MLAVLTLLILATLPQLTQTSNCSALSLVGRLLEPLSAQLKLPLSILAVEYRTLSNSTGVPDFCETLQQNCCYRHRI
jgi:hypothetical protein